MTGAPTWLQYAARKNGPIPLEPCALALLHEGPWYGLVPTGYKLMRRAPHSERAPPWGQLNKRHRTVSSGKREKTQQKNAFTLASVTAGGHHCARRALSPSTPRAFRRDPSGSEGLTAQRGQARVSVPSMQNCALAQATLETEKEELLDTRALI